MRKKNCNYLFLFFITWQKQASIDMRWSKWWLNLFWGQLCLITLLHCSKCIISFVFSFFYYFSSRGISTETLQQSCGLLVYRSDCLHLVSVFTPYETHLAAFQIIFAVIILKRCLKYWPLLNSRPPQVVWIPSVLWREWLQTVWANTEGRIRVWFPVLGWYFWFRCVWHWKSLWNESYIKQTSFTHPHVISRPQKKIFEECWWPTGS